MCTETVRMRKSVSAERSASGQATLGSTHALANGPRDRLVRHVTRVTQTINQTPPTAAGAAAAVLPLLQRPRAWPRPCCYCCRGWHRHPSDAGRLARPSHPPPPPPPPSAPPSALLLLATDNRAITLRRRRRRRNCPRTCRRSTRRRTACATRATTQGAGQGLRIWALLGFQGRMQAAAIDAHLASTVKLPSASSYWHLLLL